MGPTGQDHEGESVVDLWLMDEAGGHLVRVWVGSFSLNKLYQSRQSMAIARERRSVKKGGTINFSRKLCKMDFCRCRHVQGEKRHEPYRQLFACIIILGNAKVKPMKTFRFRCFRDDYVPRGLKK